MKTPKSFLEIGQRIIVEYGWSAKYATVISQRGDVYAVNLDSGLLVLMTRSELLERKVVLAPEPKPSWWERLFS
jgi:sRNA-binding protein